MKLINKNHFPALLLVSNIPSIKIYTAKRENQYSKKVTLYRHQLDSRTHTNTHLYHSTSIKF